MTYTARRGRQLYTASPSVVVAVNTPYHRRCPVTRASYVCNIAAVDL